MEFKSFPKIERIGKASMHITQKIHGSNAQIFIFKNSNGNLDLICGKRTSYITPENDNYGFAAFVHKHKEEFISKLGEGRHFGEWAGLGINSGEGLKDKVFVLFDFWKFPETRELPPGCMTVPVLYQGQIDLAKIDEVMNNLKTNGSKLVPGFMRPEGVVISAFGVRYKKVFEAEETQWAAGDPNYKKIKNDEDNAIQSKYGHLLQPIRLEKLLSRDEKFLTLFPESMPRIVDAYFKDLVEENQIDIEDSATIRKAIGSQLFKFVKTMIESKT